MRKHNESLQEKLLRRRVEINREERYRHEKLKAWLDDRVKAIRSAPQRVRTAFFCAQCDADWEGLAEKQIRVPKGSMWFAYYMGYCPAGHPCTRRITDRLNDPYFYKSYVIRKEQAKHADELLPHWHPRFKVLYPEAWHKMREREGLI